MGRLITSRKPGRPIRSWSALVFGLLGLFVLQAAHAGMPLNGAWRAAHAGDTQASVLTEYRAGQLNSFDPSQLHLFARNAEGYWVVLASPPPSDDDERVLTIYPPPSGTVLIYTAGAVHSLALDDFDASLHGHGRLAWKVPASLPGSAPILLRLNASTTTSVPMRFELQGWYEYLQQDAQWLVFASACFAVMLTMVLVALCFALMLRDITYIWYAGYILCYALIQGVQTGFMFHPMDWTWMAGMGSVTGPAAVALSVAFASLFMIRFCELQRYAPLLRVPVIALAVGMIQLVLMHSSHVALLMRVAETLLGPLLLIGAGLLLVVTIVAVARGSRRAWFFLAGWAPLLLLTTLNNAQIIAALPHWNGMGDIGLAGGAFEAVILSFGLADRTLSLRQDRDSVRVLADHDALTGLFNRRAWSERAQTLLNNDSARPLALLFLDLDHFKQLNDLQGHHAGDRALAAVANALAAELRPSDLLGRFGGEEFTALLDGASPEQAMHVATRLCRRVHRLEIAVSDNPRILSISIGIAIREDGDDVQSLVERADKAMYEAKLNGRNRVCVQPNILPGNPSGNQRLHVVETRK